MNATVTVFADRYGTQVNARRPMTLAEVERVIRKAKPALAKDLLPLLKFASFGDRVSADGCLRRDENVDQVSGIEGDYDGETMPMSAAVERCQALGLAALFYTSASHTPEKPRWRVLCELATPISGTEQELRAGRKKWVGVLNAVLGGVLKGESFALSQSFYFGPIKDRPAPDIVRLEGRCIDELANPPAPVFPVNGAHPATKEHAEDRSRDLYAKVRHAVRSKKSDADIHAEFDTHPHAADQKNPTLAVQRCIDKAREGTDHAPTIRLPPRQPLDFAALEGREPPERDWVMTYWLPDAHTALLAGKAGVGKTLIAQHLATSIALKHEFIAGVPRPRRVLFWAGEDDHDELWRRQQRICGYFAVPMLSLCEKLVLHSYAGADITLAAPSYGELMPTALMAELHEQVKDYQAEVVILDNVARVFGGNENDRHAVTTFLAWLQGACSPAAILLLSHPAKALGSEYSGSTAWEGAVRTRLYMSDKRPDAKPGPQDDDESIINPSERWLSRRKANYSPLDCRRFELTSDGLLVPEMGQGAIEDSRAPVSDAEMREIVRAAVVKITAMGLHATASSASPNYLPKLAQQYSLLGRVTRGQASGAMKRMLHDGQLVVRQVGKYAGNRSAKTGLAIP